MIAGLLLSVALAAAPAASASASAPKDGLSFLRQSMARNEGVKVGEWVTYRFGVPGQRAKFWRIAAVSKGKDGQGVDGVWYEIEAGEHHEFRAPLLQMKMLMADGPAGFDKKGIRRLIVQVGASKPQEVSTETIEEMAKQPSHVDPNANKDLKLTNEPLRSKTLPPMRLMTLAGTVTAVPVEFTWGRTVLKKLFMSEQVPLLHIAKMELPGMDYPVEVRDFGIDARPRMLMPPADMPKIQVNDLENYLGGIAAEGGADDDAQATP